MKLSPVVAAVLIAAGLGIPDRSWAQEPVKSFDQLNTRLKVGERVWVTDTQGHEISGKLQDLSSDALTLELTNKWTLDADGPRTFAARDVSIIQGRKDDSLVNGTLIGMGVAAGVAGAPILLACLAVTARKDAGACAGAFVGAAGMGALIGALIDANIHGPKLTVYRAAGKAEPGGASRASVSIAPVLTPRTKGVAVAFVF